MPTLTVQDGMVLLGGENRGVVGQLPHRKDRRWVVDLKWEQKDVALINTGKLRLLAASEKSYQQVASYRPAETQSWDPPALLTGGVLVKDEQTLRRWSFSRTDAE